MIIFIFTHFFGWTLESILEGRYFFSSLCTVFWGLIVLFLESPLLERKSFRIACDRFNRAYEEYREDEIIIDFMIAFEALFSIGKRVSSNVGKFIGLGCSMLLGENNRERREINEFLLKAYTIRNKIVHGSEYKTPIQIEKRKYETLDFILQLEQYLSDSLKKLI